MENNSFVKVNVFFKVIVYLLLPLIILTSSLYYYTTTGDGLIAALQVLAEMVRDQKPVSEICHLFEPYPQHLENVRFNGGSPLEADGVKKAIAGGKAALNGKGRLVIRKSGTEPLIRVMGEGEDDALVRSVISDIVTAVQQASA